MESQNILREKTANFEQMDRSFQEALDIKTRENLNLIEKVHFLESENIRLLNDNRNLSYELSSLNRVFSL